MFESRCFWLPKDGPKYTKEYEDAYQVSPESSRAAIADGVAGAMFSRQWAQLLTRAVVQNPLRQTDLESLRSWLSGPRRDWSQSIDHSSLNYFQRQKLQQVGGGYATLLWVEIGDETDSPQPAADSSDPDSEVEVLLAELVDPELAARSGAAAAVSESSAAQSPDADGAASPSRSAFNGAVPLRVRAIGDCCLFHLRRGELLRSFPLERSADFDLDPHQICSVDQGRDQTIEVDLWEGDCRDGDWVILATDAVAAWALRCYEAGRPVDWREFWKMSNEDWTERILELRQTKQMRFDDATLVLLRVGAAVAEEDDWFTAAPAEAPAATLEEPSTESVDAPPIDTAPVETHDDPPVDHHDDETIVDEPPDLPTVHIDQSDRL